jgi:hypothetical protein
MGFNSGLKGLNGVSDYFPTLVTYSIKNIPRYKYKAILIPGQI